MTPGAVINFSDMMKGFMNRMPQQRRMTVAAARAALIRQEADKMLDTDA